MMLHARCAFRRTVRASPMLVGPRSRGSAHRLHAVLRGPPTKKTPKLVPVNVSLQDQFNSATSTVKVQRRAL